MKKIVLTAMATAAVAFGAYAQGSLGNIQTMFSSDGITFGAGQANPASASDYFTGNVNIEILYSSTATAGTVSALNALAGTGANALAAAESDGFANVLASPTDTSLSAGSIEFAVSGGDFTVADPNQVGLEAPVPTSGTGALAIYAVEVNGNGGAAGWSGLLSWIQATGGNLNAAPAGTAAIVTQDPGGDNLDLTPVPEPATLAVAGLGGLSLMLFRRRK